jgi:hypothetical protein
MRTLTFYITVILSLLSLTIHSAAAIDSCRVTIQEEQFLANPFLTMHKNTQFQVIDVVETERGILERAYDTEIYAKVTFDLGNSESYGGEQLNAFLQIMIEDDIVTLKDGDLTAMPIDPNQEYSWHLSRLIVVAESGFKVVDTVSYELQFYCDK